MLTLLCLIYQSAEYKIAPTRLEILICKQVLLDILDKARDYESLEMEIHHRVHNVRSQKIEGIQTKIICLHFFSTKVLNIFCLFPIFLYLVKLKLYPRGRGKSILTSDLTLQFHINTRFMKPSLTGLQPCRLPTKWVKVDQTHNFVNPDKSC